MLPPSRPVLRTIFVCAIALCLSSPAFAGDHRRHSANTTNLDRAPSQAVDGISQRDHACCNACRHAGPAQREQGKGYDVLAQGTLNAAGALQMIASVNASVSNATHIWSSNPPCAVAGACTSVIGRQSYAWASNIVWGDNVVWGDSVYYNLPSWSPIVVWGDNVVWSDNIVWGDDVVWGDRNISSEHSSRMRPK